MIPSRFQGLLASSRFSPPPAFAGCLALRVVATSCHATLPTQLRWWQPYSNSPQYGCGHCPAHSHRADFFDLPAGSSNYFCLLAHPLNFDTFLRQIHLDDILPEWLLSLLASMPRTSTAGEHQRQCSRHRRSLRKHGDWDCSFYSFNGRVYRLHGPFILSFKCGPWLALWGVRAAHEVSLCLTHYRPLAAQ